MSAGKLVCRGVASARLLILAALIPQDELGLFGIAIIVAKLVESLSATGIRQALIHREGAVDEYLETAWTAQIVRGLLLAAVLLIGAQYFESFFEKRGLSQLLVIMAILPCVKGIYNIGIVHLHRELKFTVPIFIEIAVTITDLSVSICLALISPSASSLIIGKIVGAVAGGALSFALEKRRARRVSFSGEKFKELLNFGIWIFVSALLTYTLVNGSDIIIGKFLTTSDLAIYQVSFVIACMPIMQIMQVVSQTTFSAYSRMQDDPARREAAFLRVFGISCFVAMLSVAGMLAVGSEFTNLFLKPEYAAVDSLLPWLAVWGACRALGATNSVLFQAAGRPEFATIFQVFMVVLLAIFLIPAIANFGTLGVAICLACIGVVAQLARYVLVIVYFGIKPSAILIRVCIPMLCAAVALMVVWLAKSWFEAIWLKFVIGFISCTLSYVVVSVAADLKFRFGVLEFLCQRIPRLRALSAKTAAP